MNKKEFLERYSGAQVRTIGNQRYRIATAPQWREWIVVKKDNKTAQFDFSNPIGYAESAAEATEIAREDYRKTVVEPANEKRLERMAEELRKNGYTVTRNGK